MNASNPSHGLIVLLGSGETTASGRKAFDFVMRQLPQPPKVALLETPAGFELNSDRVIGRVADFIRQRLQNYHPQVTVVPARARGTPFSPDDPQIVAPLWQADLIFMGPGSPSYTVRHLMGSLAWQALLARHRLGAALVLASAACLAISQYALPVYEIYKVGEDLHWKPGLNFFGSYGLPLVFIPHWNNNDGGAELDTSRCFMGRERFARLMALLPPGLSVLGIDEQTALALDPQADTAEVLGQGSVTLIHTGPEHQGALSVEGLAGAGLAEVAEQRGGHVHQFHRGERFGISRLCPSSGLPGGEGLARQVWQQALAAQQAPPSSPEPSPPPEVLALLAERQAARQSKDWAVADNLRRQIAALGWQVQDTPSGQQYQKS